MHASAHARGVDRRIPPIRGTGLVVSGLLTDYVVFLRRHPAWWIIPPLLILGALAALVCFSARDDVAGLVYNL